MNSKLQQLTGAPMGTPGSQVQTPANPSPAAKPNRASVSMDPQRQREIAEGSLPAAHEKTTTHKAAAKVAGKKKR